ncbi:hypothetical protein PRNP1_001416 [Phytophthora ramorum]
MTHVLRLDSDESTTNTNVVQDRQRHHVYSRLLATTAARPTRAEASEAVTGLLDEPAVVESDVPSDELFEGSVSVGNENDEGAASQPSAADSHTAQIWEYRPLLLEDDEVVVVVVPTVPAEDDEVSAAETVPTVAEEPDVAVADSSLETIMVRCAARLAEMSGAPTRKQSSPKRVHILA